MTERERLDALDAENDVPGAPSGPRPRLLNGSVDVGPLPAPWEPTAREAFNDKLIALVESETEGDVHKARVLRACIHMVVFGTRCLVKGGIPLRVVLEVLNSTLEKDGV